MVSEYESKCFIGARDLNLDSCVKYFIEKVLLSSKHYLPYTLHLILSHFLQHLIWMPITTQNANAVEISRHSSHASLPILIPTHAIWTHSRKPEINYSARADGAPYYLWRQCYRIFLRWYQV